jgi:Uma2 family endonuclease
VAGGSLRVPMTYAAYRALGETKHHEYYDGMCVINPPSRRHAVVARRLTRVLEEWRVQTQQEFGPDVMVVAYSAPGADLLRAAPLLVVGVTSPSTRSEDWGRKLTAYAEGGAQWYWIVDPDAGEVAVFRNVAGEFAPQVRFADGRHRLAEPFPITLDLAILFR